MIMSPSKGGGLSPAIEAVVRFRRQSLMVLAVAFAALGTACSDRAPLPRSTQTVDGVTIYLGVVPAELMRGHSTAPGDPQALHGGTPKSSASHHILVALYDASTGVRITDARIRAGVGDHSYNHEPDTPLEPMEINGTITYGNFFLMQGAGDWRIHLQILRPGVSRPIEAEFAYDHVRDR